MKRFLFKFFFVLFALIAALPAQANYVFFKNTVNWSNVYVYFYKDAYWNDNGSGSSGIASGPNGMSKVYGMENIYAYDYTGDYSKYISFTKDSQTNYGNFYQTEAVYRDNFSFSTPLYTPNTISNENKNGVPYYNNGTWSTINWSDYTYWIKHDFELTGNWVWKLLKSNGDGTYSEDGVYGGGGCDYSTKEAGNESGYIGEPTLVGGPKKGDNCTFTFNPLTKTITITKKALVQLAAPTFSPAGGTFTSAQNVTISAAEGAKIYYTTNKTVPTTSSTEYSGPITVNETTTIRAIAVKDGYTNSEIAEATYTINSTPTPTTYKYALHGQITGNKNWETTAMTNDGDGIWSLTRDFVTGDFGIRKMDANGSQTGWLGWPYIGSPADNCEASGSNIKLTADGNYTISFNTETEKITVTKNSTSTGDIPVYPAGVNSEAELSAYNFGANPVYYLLADVLNANRVTPEWQLTKGADGLYHLNGFAMRNTGAVKVRQYTSAGTYVDYTSQAFTDLSSEGQLYNATFNPNGNSLSLTPASGTKMPFISLVGYMMQQDQVYDTPRGVEGTPVGTKSSTGWQEAWLLYDANGKLLKDRKGNVMYSTMWPPKNPVYFTATIGSNQRLYSSDQMTFVPVQKDGNNVGKTGAEWKAELEKLDEEAYKGLSLDPNKTYYRYVVSDIWYVGAGKIWTGWGGETTYDNNKQIAQWSKHKNWGYEDKNATDTEGTAIDAQTTYNVVKDKGNFLFENPTYFKTFEFFYETGDPNANSQIYTTLAYGSASIAAKNVKEGESYKKGSYQAKVSLPEGVTISNWTITRHDATTDALAPIGSNNVSDNGVVATYTAEKKDPTSTEFTEDKGGLGEGRYYYELTVTFSNGRTSTVRSNPFVIYYPNQYSVDANGYQLVKLDEKTADDYSYVTYNAKANGDLYFVEFTDNTVSKFRVATSAERESLNGKFAKNEGIKWTDKVFVYAPVPSEFKIDAEKASATVSLDKITSYNVNSTTGIAPVQKELAVVDLKQNFANKVYKAVMNYQQKDPAAETWSNKISLGKENLTVMRMPNVKGGEVTVTVTPTENNEVLTINYNGTDKKYAANYYNVDVELPFSDPNVEAAVAPQYEVKVTDSKGATTKVYTASASGTGDRALTFTNVNPLDFEGKSIEVNAKYFDGTGYNLYANLGESAKLASGTVKFTGCTPDFHTLNAIASKAPVLDENGNMIKDDQGYHKQKDVIVVTNLGVSHSGTYDNIGGKLVDAGNALYNADFYLEGAAAYNGVYTIDQLNFAATEEFENGHHVWKNGAIIFDNKSGVTQPALNVEITPFYVAKVTNTEGTVGLTVPGGSATQGDETYVALTCKTAVKDGLQLTTSIVDITDSANVKAYKVIENGEIYIIYGDRKFNVMGAEVK